MFVLMVEGYVGVMSDKTNVPEPARDLQLGPEARLRAFVLLALTIAGIYVFGCSCPSYRH
jgi:hypothetical protein